MTLTNRLLFCLAVMEAEPQKIKSLAGGLTRSQSFLGVGSATRQAGDFHHPAGAKFKLPSCTFSTVGPTHHPLAVSLTRTFSAAPRHQCFVNLNTLNFSSIKYPWPQFWKGLGWGFDVLYLKVTFSCGPTPGHLPVCVPLPRLLSFAPQDSLYPVFSQSISLASLQCPRKLSGEGVGG